MLFDSKEELIEIMKGWEPDIYVKGSDWKSNSGTAHQYSKEVIYYDRVGEYSTTNIIQRIADR
jgi:bifunctional ADP-heptose synthase (sugar kinase/adenylyltransferase)